MNEEFEKAVALTKTFTSRPTNQELLKLYALYKQATSGDNEEERPTGFDFKGIAKHDAWLELKGKSKEEAQSEYIDFVSALSENYI